MEKSKFFSILFMILFLNVIFISTNVYAEKKYEIPSGENLVLSFSASKFSLMNIEIDNSISNNPFNFELRHQGTTLIASRTNYTENLIMSFIGIGVYTVTIQNENLEQIELSIIQETFKLETNDETGGFSFKKKVYCWSFNTDEISAYKTLSVESLAKRRYYNMYVITKEQDTGSNIWVSSKHPDEGVGWNDYLDPFGYTINSKKQIRLEDGFNWIVYYPFTSSSYDVLIFLKLTVPGTVLQILVGLGAAVVGVVIFILYYFDPLKYRKRKVKGKTYDSMKKDYESPDSYRDNLKELLESNTSEKKSKK